MILRGLTQLPDLHGGELVKLLEVFDDLVPLSHLAVGSHLVTEELLGGFDAHGILVSCFMLEICTMDGCGLRADPYE